MALSRHSAVLAGLILFMGLAQPGLAAAQIPQLARLNKGVKAPKPLPVMTTPPKDLPGMGPDDDRGIIRTMQLPTEYLRDIRRRMVAKKTVSFKELQALADASDGMAAYFLATRIEETGKPEMQASASHYYSMAAGMGRGAAVPPLVKLLDAHGEKFQPAVLAEAQAALEKQVRLKHSVAIDALARYYSQGEVFPRDTARAQKLMSQAAKDGNAKAALDIAYQLLSGTPDENQRADALGYLEIVAKSGEIGQRAIAESLIRDLQAPAAPTTNVSEITP